MNKTVHTAETDPASIESDNSELRATDPAGAAIELISRLCDVLVVSRPLSGIVNALWRERAPHPRSRLPGVPLTPVTGLDASGARSEALALVGDGLRVALVDTAPAREAAEASRHPLVRYVLGEASDTDAPADPLTLTARSPQEVVDFGLVAHMAAERSLCPATLRIETDLARASFDAVVFPDPQMLAALVGRPPDEIDSPDAYQKQLFGPRRRRIPQGIPAEAEAGKLAAGAKKILSQCVAEFEAASGRTAGEPEVTSRREEAGRSLTATVVSSRAFSFGRFVAEIVAAQGGPVSLVGRPGDVAVRIVWGHEPAADMTDILVAPGTGRARLAGALGKLRNDGAVLLQSDTEDPEETWKSLPANVRDRIRDSERRVFSIRVSDASESESESELEYAVANFLNAVRVSGLPGSHRSNGEHDALAAPGAPVQIPWRVYEEEPDFYSQEARLHLAAVPATEPSEDSRRRLLAYHYTGLHTGQRIDDAGLVPAQLWPHAAGHTPRRPFPVLLPDSDDADIVTLATLMDELREREFEGVSADSYARTLARLESAMRDAHAADEALTLSEGWKRSAERIAAASGTETEGTESIQSILSDLLGGLPHGRLHDFGPGTSREIVARTAGREWKERFAPVKEDADGLAVLMEEFLRADFEGSEEGHAPDHLKAAVGKGYSDELDFDAMSRFAQETSPRDTLTESQRARIEAAARDLRTLPARLADTRQQSSLSGTASLGVAVARTHENLRTVAALIRAIRIALLESSGNYREDRHDPMFERFGVEHLTEDERALCPPFLVEVTASDGLTRTDRGMLMEVLGTRLPVKVLLSLDRLPDMLGEAGDRDVTLSIVSALPRQAVGLGTAYVYQGPASEVSTFTTAAEEASRFHGPALLAQYYGSPSASAATDDYLAAAMALESRAFPVFSFDPSGPEWADRIRIDQNPAVGDAWGRGETAYAAEEGDGVLSSAFTFADFLSLEADAADHFRVVPQSEWQPEMVSVDEFVNLGAAEAADRIPFIWMADERGRLCRAVVTYPVTDAVREVQDAWRTLQELGGVRSSFADRILEQERAALEKERDRIAEEAQERLRDELDKATGSVAREIVSNIAAGLLGLKPTSDTTMPVAAPAPDVAAAPEPDETPEDSAETTAAPVEEEEEPLVLDEPYIETPRCTTCNECTNMNSRMFAYDDNKQAYIKDASAGTFKELVMAAEKCPVRIIHPGKPLNPDEQGLEDLIKRAQPFQ